MIAYFSKLHHQVHEVLHFGLRLEHLEQLLHVQLFFNGLIQNLLAFGHFAQDLMLVLLADLVLDVLLDAAQHERLQNGVQSLNFDLVELFLVLTVCLDVLGEPLIEQLMGVEEVRHHKVEQRPQFGHVVLDRRTGE